MKVIWKLNGKTIEITISHADCLIDFFSFFHVPDDLLRKLKTAIRSDYFIFFYIDKAQPIVCTTENFL